mgnify:CR=1 FL=1
MKCQMIALTLGAIIAGTAPMASAAAKKAAPRGELKTEIKFGDHDLRGEYQTPDEALANVENEKGLNQLLGVRKHFKDRLQMASEQE